MIAANDDVRLLQGGCLEVLKALPDKSVGAIVTDPPYGLSKDPDMAEACGVAS